MNEIIDWLNERLRETDDMANKATDYCSLCISIKKADQLIEVINYMQELMGPFGSGKSSGCVSGVRSSFFRAC